MDGHMSISTIVFDFGNVVAFFSHLRAAQQLAAYGKMPAEEVAAALFGGALEDDYESGRMSTADFVRRVREACGVCCTDEQFCSAFADMFWPNPEVCELVPLLKGRYKLLLLSNTNELHSRHFRRQFAGVLAHFDAVVCSHEVGVRKPDRRVFEHCLRLARARPGECVFIDDLPANVEAARACGWHGIVYRPGEDLRRRLAALGVSAPAGPSRPQTPRLA
jgi:putative hydrolase of the HAD superfamily